MLPYLDSTLKTTFSFYKVLTNSSNSPLPAIPDKSTNHIADSTEPACCALAGRPVEVLTYWNAICLVIVTRLYRIINSI